MILEMKAQCSNSQITVETDDGAVCKPAGYLTANGYFNADLSVYYQQSPKCADSQILIEENCYCANGQIPTVDDSCDACDSESAPYYINYGRKGTVRFCAQQKTDIFNRVCDSMDEKTHFCSCEANEIFSVREGYCEEFLHETKSSNACSDGYWIRNEYGDIFCVDQQVSVKRASSSQYQNLLILLICAVAAIIISIIVTLLLMLREVKKYKASSKKLSSSSNSLQVALLDNDFLEPQNIVKVYTPQKLTPVKLNSALPAHIPEKAVKRAKVRVKGMKYQSKVTAKIDSEIII